MEENLRKHRREVGTWGCDSRHSWPHTMGAGNACGEEAPAVAQLRDGGAGALHALLQRLGEGCFWEAFLDCHLQICSLQLLGELLKQKPALLVTEVQPAHRGGAPGRKLHWLHSVSSPMKYEKDQPSGCCKIRQNICYLLRTREASVLRP